MSEKNVHCGHRKRLRDRALTEGLENFNPHQVLELLLFYAIPRQDTSEIAHHLIERFGSVNAALNASQEELVQVTGVGKKVAEWLKNIGALTASYSQLRSSDRPKLTNLRSVLQFCIEKRGKCKIGTTYHICVAPTGTIQKFSSLCDSLAWGEAAVLRNCLREVLAVKARNVIILEFVNTDQPIVEEYERVSAAKYAQTLGAIGAELLDIVLIGYSSVVSLFQNGDLNRAEFGGARSYLSENYLREDSFFEEDSLVDEEEE